MTITIRRPVGDTPAAQVANAIKSHLYVRPEHNWLHLAADVIDQLRRQPTSEQRDREFVAAVAVITTHPNLTNAEKLQALGLAA